MAQVLPDLQAELAALRAQNEALLKQIQSAPAQRLTFKVSEKGAISVYGMGRFPLTLYKSQLRRLEAHWLALLAFAKANDHLLATKE